MGVKEVIHFCLDGALANLTWFSDRYLYLMVKLQNILVSTKIPISQRPHL